MPDVPDVPEGSLPVPRGRSSTRLDHYVDRYAARTRG